MLHFISRFGLHVIASAAVYVLAYFLLIWLHRKHWEWGRLILPGVVVFALMASSEVYNVAFGKDAHLKAVFDLISWVAGAGLSAWGIKRLRCPS